MEKVLVVEDGKALSALLKKRIEENLGFAVDVAANMAEAVEAIEKSEYLAALLDLNLPDAPDGEIVDFVLSKDIRKECRCKYVF